jgi:glycosyltransferase involved in cell wall biosynthesis
MASQLLIGLSELGHNIEAIAPITSSALRLGDRFAKSNQALRVTRVVVPEFDISPDTSPSAKHRDQERRQVAELVTRSIARRSPDILLVGRESFAAHVTGLTDTPSVLIVQASPTTGANGNPAALAKSFLRNFRQFDVAVESAIPILLRNFRQFDVVVTPAAHMQRRLAELGVPKVEIIPNPVDLDRFRPGPASVAVRRALGVGDTDLVVMHLSNLKAVKRPLDIVDAAEVALREDNRLVFVIVGDGPFRTALEEAAAKRGVAARFRFPGWIDHDRVPEFIRSADIVVMPSQEEVQALIYLETQASARPLIASDIAAAQEVIEDGCTGLLFAAGDTHQLAERILLCARDARLRVDLGRKARRYVARHTLQSVVAAYSDLLGSVAASPPRERER